MKYPTYRGVTRPPQSSDRYAYILKFTKSLIPHVILLLLLLHKCSKQPGIEMPGYRKTKSYGTKTSHGVF